MSDFIASGVKITVDTSDIDVKFLKSVERLNETLTKNQKALGLVYSEQGLLTNALGRCVEGLSTAQIKLGQYVDELGRIRTFQGGFVDGLTKTQLALGFYRDEMGAVRNASGELVEGLNETTDAVDRLAKELDDAQRASRDVGDAFSALPGPLADAFDLLERFEKVADLFEKNELSAEDFCAILSSKLVRGAQVAAAAVSGLLKFLGPANVAFAVLAGVALVFGGKRTSQSSEIEEYSERFKELETRARAAGKEVETLGDALQFGGSGGGTKIQEALRELERIRSDGLTQEQRETADSELFGAVGTWIDEICYKFDNFFTGAAEKETNARKAQVSEFVAEIIESQRSRKEIARERLADVRAALAETNPGDDGTRGALNAEIARIESELAGWAQEDAGMAEFAAKPKLEATLENYEATLAKWSSLVDEGKASSEDLATAQENLKKKLRDDLAKDLGVDFAAPKSADETFEEGSKRLADALAKGVVSSDGFAAAQDQLRDQYADALAARQVSEDSEKTLADQIGEWNDALAQGKVTQDRCNEAVEALEKSARDRLFSETGVDGEKELSPIEKYDANVKKWADALEAGTVEQEEYAVAVQKLRDAARAEIGGLEASAAANDEYQAALARLNEARKSELIDEEELSRLQREAEKKRSDARADELSDLGYGDLLDRAAELDKSTAEEEKTARDRYREALDRYADALESGRITQEEYAAAQEALRKIRDAELKEETDKAAEAAEKKRSDARAKLGVDALMESLKTPAEKYDERMAAIAESAKAGEINSKERLALENKAADDYWEAMEANNKKFGEATKSLARGGGKVELAKSMSSGSEALYLAQVRGITANYQSRIQTTTAEIRDAARESLYQTTQTNAYLQAMSSGDRRFVFSGN